MLVSFMAMLLACTISSILISDPALSEVSGMVATPDTLWVHNDSGDGPYIYGLTRDAQRVAHIQFATTQPIDAEAVAMDGDTIYIGDTGRNASGGALYTVHRWPDGEPITFRFPQNEVIDIEAMLVVNGTVMVITKGVRSNLYALEGNVMQKVGQLRNQDGGKLCYVTDATRDGDTILVRSTYPRSSLHLFDWSEGIKLQAERALPVINEPQGEAVALLGDTYWTMSEYERRGYSFLHRYEGCLQWR